MNPITIKVKQAHPLNFKEHDFIDRWLNQILLITQDEIEATKIANSEPSLRQYVEKEYFGDNISVITKLELFVYFKTNRFYLNAETTTIDYTCIAIIDNGTYICYDPKDGKIFHIPHASKYDVIAVP